MRCAPIAHKSHFAKNAWVWHVELICCRTSVLSGEIQSIKTRQDRSGSLSLLQANKWAFISEKILKLDQKICQADWRMLQVLSADYTTTTSTSSSTVSKMVTPTH